MKQFFFGILCLLSISSFSKEWKSLQHYQKETNQITLAERDWLSSDRKQNTKVWQQANIYNLQNNLPEEYTSIKQRRDFYKWYYSSLEKKGHEVVWPKMAHFIANKLKLIKSFPFNFFTDKKVKAYAKQGNKTVFDAAFTKMKELYFSTEILQGKEALQWDDNIIHLEQEKWLYPIYETINERSKITIERMAKGKGFYSLMVPREIRFKGDISNARTRYEYALNILRSYCENNY
ncbi:Insecticidal toxin complex protein [Oceanihabitans sediminis]|uniref:Insecticidal toxin complex protein n=1 Tax=Oceanihabitans sediminis TaxID=1812012 RepID=A0A368P428_9FLAO|nr:Insecticidal toxin complex protein [Oceanihabitans sediminis]MDX1278533.1 Insecticidal toxin complex protein [Oceanihabitans sediminis]RBP29923.1 hypothetical protein DFR65_105149 [Oceanihabitans sediminis]RCU57258.1 Insecticidal toxin complex protein [Oceanihabitans sediminis]